MVYQLFLEFVITLLQISQKFITSEDVDERVNRTQPYLTRNQSFLFQKNINKNNCPLLLIFSTTSLTGK